MAQQRLPSHAHDSEDALLLQEDQHFIVWMRTAALRNFRKLWGRMEAPIPAGATITVRVQNRCKDGSLPFFARPRQ